MRTGVPRVAEYGNPGLKDTTPLPSLNEPVTRTATLLLREAPALAAQVVGRAVGELEFGGAAARVAIEHYDRAVCHPGWARSRPQPVPQKIDTRTCGVPSQLRQSPHVRNLAADT